MHREENNVKRVLVLGLDFTGKSTVLQSLNLGAVQTITPIHGFTFETVRYRNVQFTSWDIGGRMPKSILEAWKPYFENVIGVIWVVDSNDRDRFIEVREELQRQIFRREQLEGVPLCVLANKQDLPGAMTAEEITEKLQLIEKLASDSVKMSRPWRVQGASAMEGWGCVEGAEWLSRSMNGTLRLPWHDEKTVPEKVWKLFE